MRLDRRRFFTRSALALGAVATGEAIAASRAQAPGDPPPADRLRERIAFDGPHQAGVLEEPRDAVVLAALDAIAPDTQRLGRGLAMLSARARELTQGWRMPPKEADDPPHQLGQFANRELVGIAQVDRANEIVRPVHHPDHALDQVVAITE